MRFDPFDQSGNESRLTISTKEMPRIANAVVQIENGQKSRVDQQRKNANDHQTLIDQIVSNQKNNSDDQQNEDQNEQMLNKIHLNSQNVPMRDERRQKEKKFHADENDDQADLKVKVSGRQIGR